jgi:S-adenosylmethionine synthetase
MSLDHRLHFEALPDITMAAVEIVERKGLGQPDSICDALAEAASQALCRLYQERAGTILHHNVDKVLLWGGTARPAFGGGRILKPFEIFLAGRATRRFKGIELPIDQIIEDACRTWIRTNLPSVNVDRHVRLRILLRPVSEDLSDLFLRRALDNDPLANDTSCGIGYAPLSPLEKAVDAVERSLNAPTTKVRHPEIGQDIKVMAIRGGEDARFTISTAFIDAHIASAQDYAFKKLNVRQLVHGVANQFLGTSANVEINTADRPPDSVYLTVTGTSAEAGDDGEAGRGNRANGLITPYRPMTMESLAGKNPVSHVGKLYSLAAGLIAQTLADMEGITAAECYLVSQIGRPITEPQIIDIRIRPMEGADIQDFRSDVQEVVALHLRRLDHFADDLLAGRLSFDRWPLSSAR